MSKKNINRVLIVGVSIIWGILLYKFINTMAAKDDSVVTNNTTTETKITAQVAKDTFRLKTYQRDPFLGDFNKPVVIRSNTGSGKKIVEQSVPINQKWPVIEYLGFVKEEHAKPLLLIKINKRLYRKKASENFIDGLKVVSFYKDSIEVTYNEEKRIIRKN